MGEGVSEEVLTGGVWGQLARALGKRRWLRTVAEAGYDTMAWICGLLVAAGATSGLAGVHLSRAVLWYGALGMCVLVAGCGLAAGLYRGRHLRGSRDEVAAVMLAAALTACCLVLVGPLLMSRQRAVPETVVVGAALRPGSDARRPLRRLRGQAAVTAARSRPP